MIPALNEDFRELLEALAEHEVDFALVGGHAVGFHGAPRATGDMDVLVRPSAENAQRVVAALRAFGAPLALHGVGEGDFQRPGTVYQMGLPPRRIDVLTRLSGPEVDDILRDAVPATLDGLEVRVISREHLLENKRASGRPKDFADLALLAEAGEG